MAPVISTMAVGSTKRQHLKDKYNLQVKSLFANDVALKSYLENCMLDPIT